MTYIPKQGDIVWLNFDPQTGHEQRGRRPAVIVSNNAFNRFSVKAAMVCPITSNNKGIPHHMRLEGETKTSGVIMTDQAKILDIADRKAEFIEELPRDILLELVDIIYGFIYVEDEIE